MDISDYNINVTPINRQGRRFSRSKSPIPSRSRVLELSRSKSANDDSDEFESSDEYDQRRSYRGNRKIDDPTEDDELNNNDRKAKRDAVSRSFLDAASFEIVEQAVDEPRYNASTTVTDMLLNPDRMMRDLNASVKKFVSLEKDLEAHRSMMSGIKNQIKETEQCIKSQLNTWNSAEEKGALLEQMSEGHVLYKSKKRKAVSAIDKKSVISKLLSTEIPDLSSENRVNEITEKIWHSLSSKQLNAAATEKSASLSESNLMKDEKQSLDDNDATYVLKYKGRVVSKKQRPVKK